MADYGQQSGRDYRHNGGPGSGGEPRRDAAYANVFGDERPTARSQTMTSDSYNPQQHYPNSLQGRSQTMSSQTTNMDRGPPIQQQRYQAYPGGQGGSDISPNGYGPPPRSQTYQGPAGAYPPHDRERGPPMMRGPPPMGQRGPPPQGYGYPQQRGPYEGGYPPRGDSRMMPPRNQYPTPAAVNRYPNHPQGSGDPYQRSFSLASSQPPRMPTYPPPAGPGPGPGPSGSPSPAQAFRQQQYNPMSRTTAQGRVVPERPDERTMSMGSYQSQHEQSQTSSGRVIPHRRPQLSDVSIPDRSSPSQGSTTPTSPVANRTRTASGSSQQAPPPQRSFSTASTAVSEQPKLNGNSQTDSQRGMIVHQRRTPLVYPAMLSKVALSFRQRVNLANITKDGLDYSNAFTGEDAVTTIAYIIKTTDRNLALLLGRSLDAQKFFHDVTYAHRLRDLRSEVYQFRVRDALVEDQPEVNGVFTLLTECYSPTCTRDRLCYSIACPRRLEQQARLKLRPQPGLKRADSHTSLHEEASDEQKLWINTVSKDVAESVSEKERKRQEVISELAYTERDFVKDIEYMRDFWMKPLRSSRSPIKEGRRDQFVKTVFSNISEIYGVNHKLAEALTKRQQEQPVVNLVGDIFLEHVQKFAPFITYGAAQLMGKYEYESERKTNPLFAKFVEDTERLKESRKLELNGYLTKPTTRLARYPLLLENILKYTADDSTDKLDIPKAITSIRDFLAKVNAESGKAENRFTTMQLSRELYFRPGEQVDLKLNEENRQLLFKGMLKRTPNETQGDIQAYLFDHALLLVRVKTVNKKEDLKVFKKPIPLELLVIAEMHEILPKGGLNRRPSTGLMGSRTTTMTSQMSRDSSKPPTFPLTFKHLGRGGYEITLYCSTQIQQQKFIEHIDAQQRVLRNRTKIFAESIISEGFFTAANRVNCCAPIDGGLKLLLGTESGLYLLDRKPKDASAKPRRVLDCKSVTQIEVLEQHRILLVLTEKTVCSYPMDALDPDESANSLSKRGRKICHANFFKAGISQGQQLVCCVKTSALSTTLKVYEPMDTITKKSKKSGLAKMLASSQDVLKPLKEYYIPAESSSIHFLKSTLCVGCARGFEIISLETLEAQSLLDQADTSLDFVQRKENIKPIHIERIQSEFLLCYTDYSFFVNREGWRARPEWIITWEGTPNAFAVFNPYILAFEPSFIEIRHMETGMLVTIVTGRNVRMLHSSSREILYAYEDELGVDVIASMDFWGRPTSGQAHLGHAHSSSASSSMSTATVTTSPPKTAPGVTSGAPRMQPGQPPQYGQRQYAQSPAQQPQNSPQYPQYSQQQPTPGRTTSMGQMSQMNAMRTQVPVQGAYQGGGDYGRSFSNQYDYGKEYGR